MTENEKKTNQNIETEAQTAENTGVKEAVKNDFESNGGASANQTDGQNSHFEAGEKPEKTVPDVSKNKKKNVVICCSIVVVFALVAGIVTANSKAKADQKQPGSDKTADIAEKTDTEPPVITLKKDKLEMNFGDSYNVATNIKSVIDDQDGKLEQVMKLENGKAGYIIESEQIKEAKAGTFSVEVTAVDSAGNKAKSSFDVVVSEAKTEEKTDTEKTFGADKEEKKETSSAKSGNSDKVTSASTSKPSAGSSGSNKPSTGGSSSGSGSAAKPSGGSGSSGSSGGSSGGSTPAPKPKPDCTTETIYHPAETHTVTHPAETTTVEHPAETEKVWVVDVPAHEEPIYEYVDICNSCGMIFTNIADEKAHILGDVNSPCFGAGTSCDVLYQTGTNAVPEQGHYQTITKKEAWTETVVVKDAWTETVTDKEAWTETKESCS